MWWKERHWVYNPGKIQIFLIFYFVECFSWENSFGDQAVNANRSGKVDLRFKFSFGSANRQSTTIKCGYVDLESLSLKTVVQKIGENSPTFVSGHVFGSRASLYTMSGQPNVLGITISTVKKTDPVQYRCKALFQGSSSINDVVSDLKKLVVLGKNIEKKLSLLLLLLLLKRFISVAKSHSVLLIYQLIDWKQYFIKPQ